MQRTERIRRVSLKPANPSLTACGRTLQDRSAQQVEIPPEVNQVSLPQQKALQADLSGHVARGSKQSQILEANMKRAKDGIDRLTNRVNALPKTPAFQPFRDRLTSIDAQFQAAGKLVNLNQGRGKTRNSSCRYR